MALTQLSPPFPIFTDRTGRPLDGGYLYFGEVDQDPETAPITVYFDSALTQPAVQPLRTSAGYVMRDNAPALLYADGKFSVTVKDKQERLVIYAPSTFGLFDETGLLFAENNLSDVDSASAARTNLGLAIGTDVQAYNATLQSISNQTLAGNAGKYLRVAAGGAAVEFSLGNSDVLIERQKLTSSDTSIDFFFDGSLYDEVYAIIPHYEAVAPADLTVRFSTDGSTFVSTTDYSYITTTSLGTTVTASTTTAGNSFNLGPLSSLIGSSFKVSLLGVSDADRPTRIFSDARLSSNGAAQVRGSFAQNAVINGISFLGSPDVGSEVILRGKLKG